MTFEGLQELEQVQNFYNGGTGGNGSGPGPNFGVTFSNNAIVAIDSDAGGTGNFANEPSPSTVLLFLSGGAVTMNVPAGFTTGFSFFYTSNQASGTVFVYDGLNATGNQLASLNLTPLGPGVGDPNGGANGNWAAIGVNFNGIARSVDFGGVVNLIAFDDITLGSAVAGVVPAAEVPPVLFRPRAGDPDPYLLVDIGAINSLLSTGLLMPVIQRQAVHQAASGAIRDLNSRLFRARTMGREATPGDGPIHSRLLDGLIRPFESTTDTSTIRYLNFAAAQNIDYRVALGLREGVEVEYQHDSMVLGDTFWATSPFALSGGPALLSAAPGFTKAVIAAPAGATPGGKEVFEDKLVIVEPAYKRFEVFTEFDYGFYDQDSLTHLVRGFDSDTYAASAGMEYRLFPWLHIGGAFTYLENNTDVSSNLGSVDLDGTMLSGYFTAFWKQFYLDALYSYGDFNNEISRNTLLGRNAHGDTESYAHNIDLNLGYNIRLSDQIQTGPFTGLNYATGGIDGYTERNGGNANLVYPDDDYESMIGRLGWQMSYTTDTAVGRVTAQGRAGWAREFMPEADSVRAGLTNSPFILVTGNSAHRVGGFAAEADSAHAGTDWLELGAGLRLDLNDSWNVQLDYDGQFARNNASAHFAALKVEYEWDHVFLPGLGGGGKGVVAETGGGADPLEGAIAAAPAAKSKSGGLKGLFAAKAPHQAEAPASEPFADAKPVAPASVLGDGPMKPAAVSKSSGGAGKPVTYESWDQVPGRRKVSAPVAEPVAAPVPQEASVEQVKPAPAEKKSDGDHSVPVVETGPVASVSN